MITQADIARELGVSFRVVGAVLGQNSKTSTIRVGAQTRQRVLRTAKRLNYRPHRQAQLLRGVKSGVIGIIKPTSVLQSAMETSFFASQAIQEAGYGLLVNELLWDDQGLRRAVDSMLDAHVEGVLLAAGGVSRKTLPEVKRLIDAKIPLVSLAGTHLPSIPLVAPDHRQGMQDLAKHLLAIGHRKLTFASPLSPAQMEEKVGATWDRWMGLREAVAAAATDDVKITQIFCPREKDFTDIYASGKEAGRQLLKSDQLPDVVLCSNDLLAVGVMSACKEATLRMPEDLAITGFDNAAIGRYVFPQLTSVAQPSEEVAKRAFALLLKQIRREKIEVGERLIKVPCRLVIRTSCGALRQQATGK